MTTTQNPMQATRTSATDGPTFSLPNTPVYPRPRSDAATATVAPTTTSHGEGAYMDQDEQDPLTFAPIPIVTGTQTADGTPVASIEVVVTDENGNEHRYPLVAQHGAWWAQAPGQNG